MHISQCNVFWPTLYKKSLYLPQAKYKTSNKTTCRKVSRVIMKESVCLWYCHCWEMLSQCHTQCESLLAVTYSSWTCFLRTFYMLTNAKINVPQWVLQGWESEENLGREIWPHTKQLLTTVLILHSTRRNVLNVSYPIMMIDYWHISLLLLLATFQEMNWEFWINYNMSFPI